MIHLTDINKTYQGAQPLHVLKGINLDIAEGELVSIMGASGSGKSTLLNILGLLDTYDTGKYMLNGMEVYHLNDEQEARLRNKTIGFVFQNFNLINYKSAVENVEMPLFYAGVSRKERRTKALEYLDRVGLLPWADHLPTEMSGGQKQRVAIARALITEPKVILADEPTGALDATTTKEVMNLLLEINRKQNITMIVVTHEKDVADLCDRTIHIVDGRIRI